MAKKKSTRKQPQERGHGEIKTVEQLNDDQLAALTFQHKKNYERDLKAKKKADADLKNTCKIIKAELGANGIDDIKDLIAMDTEGGEKKLSSLVERVMRVARWGGHMIQMDMFKVESGGRAYELGKAAGLRGDMAKPPYGPGTADSNDWLMGHADGNKARNVAMQKAVDGEAFDDAEHVPAGGGDQPEHASQQH